MTNDPNRPTTYGATERELDQAADAAEGTIDTMRDKAEDVVGDVKDKAAQVGSQVAEKADTATTTVGEKITGVAQTIRQKAPASGPIADAADTAADTLQRAGSYLQEQDLADMRADLEGLIRRHPIESLLIGFGLGYLLARGRRR
jgi:ABC-type transporter Mla subunit MlaD